MTLAMAPQENSYHSALLLSQSAPLLLTLAAIFLVLKGISMIRLWMQRRRLAREHGCQPVVHYVGSWPFGLDAILEERRAYEENNLPNLMIERFRKYGHTMRINCPRRMKYFTMEPKLVQAILSTHFENFPKRPLASVADGFLGQHSIFMVDGPEWEQARAMLKPQFLRDQVADFTDLEKHVERFLARAYPLVNTHDVAKRETGTITTDIQPLFFDLLFDSATENLLGKSADTQLLKDKGLASDAVAFSTAFDLATDVVALKLVLGKLASWLFLGWETNMAYNQACRTCQEYVRPYVDNAIKKMRVVDAVGDKETPKAKKWIALNEFVDEYQTQDKEALWSHSMGFLIAGRDTTSAMLSWAIYLLARHPEAYSKLREQIIESSKDHDGSQRLPDYTTLKSLPYLRWVLKETLRLYPVVAVNERVAKNDIVLPIGGGPDGQAPMLLKAGEGIVWSLYSIHRRKDLYGEDAEEFRPERWGSDEKGRGLKTIGWGYLPFHGGPRVCMGQQRALNEGSYILARIAQTFSAIEVPDDVDIEKDRPQFKMGIITISSNGVRVKLTKA